MGDSCAWLLSQFLMCMILGAGVAVPFFISFVSGSWQVFSCGEHAVLSWRFLGSFGWLFQCALGVIFSSLRRVETLSVFLVVCCDCLRLLLRPPYVWLSFGDHHQRKVVQILMLSPCRAPPHTTKGGVGRGAHGSLHAWIRGSLRRLHRSWRPQQ